LKVLEKAEGKSVEVIPIEPEDGIYAIAFTFKEIIDEISKAVEEVAMDSTCR
jgi:hypothetical protein